MDRSKADPRPLMRPADVRSPTFWSHHPVRSAVERSATVRLTYLLWFTGFFFLTVSSTYVAVLPQFRGTVDCSLDGRCLQSGDGQH